MTDGGAEGAIHSVGQIPPPARFAMVFEFVRMLGSTAALQGANVLLQLILARLVAPEAFGDLTLVLILATYLGYLQLGVSNAMNRDVPLFTGRGDRSRVNTIREVALAGTVVAAVAGGLLMVMMPGRWFGSIGGTIALLAGAAYLITYHLYSYAVTYLQSSTQFDAFSRLQTELALGTVALAIPLTILGGPAGALAGMALAQLVAAGIAWKRHSLPVSVRFAGDEWRRLVRVGFPILMVSIGYVLLTTVDRWVIKTFLGGEALGQYAFQARFVSLGVLVTTLIANQVYPRVAETWGRTGDVRRVLEVMRRPGLACVGVSLLAALGLLVVLPPIIPRLWPAYAPSITLMPYLLIGMIFLPLCSLLGVLLNVLDRQVSYLVVQAAALVVALLLVGGVARNSRDIVSTAMASAASYGLYWLLLAGLSFRVVRRELTKAAA